MKCKICGSEKVSEIYNGKIRDGRLEHYTDKNIKMYQCDNCQVIWHKPLKGLSEYYESTEYRQELEGSSDENEFYRLHDRETLDKLQYTGTEIYREKTVADIGCGCGAFLDYIHGVATEVIAVEPSATYRKIMDKKGFHTYPYATEARKDWEGTVDVITSFDVIEHVEDPKQFLQDCYRLLKKDGVAIIGTPTDAPVMRNLLGEIYEKKLLFSTQHLWILSGKSLMAMSEEVGFSKCSTKYYQRYGIGNMLGWVRDKTAGSAIEEAFLTDTLNQVWKKECESQGLSDYVVLYVTK